MRYRQLAKAYAQMCYGPHSPSLLSLNVEHKSKLVMLMLHSARGLYNADRYEEMMRAPWILYKGSMMVFREDVPPDILRGWFIGNYRGDGVKRGLVEEVTFS